MGRHRSHLNCAPFYLVLFVTSLHINRASCNLPPSFIQTIDLSIVNENTPLGSTVNQLKAIDPEGSNVTYGIEGTSLFRVDSSTGMVFVNGPIDRETIGDSVRFYVTVEDFIGGDVSNNLVKVPITILVNDENDNKPRFSSVAEGRTLKLKMNEDSPSGWPLIRRIEVSDADSVGSILKVSCDGCQDKFAIKFNDDFPEATNNLLVFSISTNRDIEYKSGHNRESFRLIASDGFHNTTLNVEVLIEDVQNKPPVFIGSTSAIISEDAPIGAFVIKVKAIDGDAMTSDSLMNIPSVPGRPVVYELMQHPSKYFSIDSKSGIVTVASKMDKESFPQTNGVVTIKVKATETDARNQMDTDMLATSTVTITVTLQDVNDEPPRPNKESFTVSVYEGVPNGTPLSSLDMVFEDKDSGSNSVFNLALIDPSGIFSIEPPVATGSTSVSIRVAKGPIDYEKPTNRKYTLQVVATEAFTKEKLSRSATVTVNVLDVNDNQPEFAQEYYTTSVPEDSIAGTIITTIRATDKDSDAITNMEYSLFGNGADLFTVNPTTGVLTVAECPTPGKGNCIDYEMRQSYFLSFQASDGFGQTSIVPLTITVSDTNDHPPQFVRDQYNAIIDEGTSAFEPQLKVKATDADVTSKITYSIVAGNVDNLFDINEETGEIMVTKPAKNKHSNIELKVQASDGGHGVATTNVNIHIRDSNDNFPIFDKPIYTATVSETAGPLTFVEQVHATDLDTGLNAAIEYRILRGAYDEFVINPETGKVLTSPTGHTKLDYDRKSSYEIEIVARDKGVPFHTGSCLLQILVINHNDKNPYFTPSTQRTQINENIHIGTRFYRMRAQDPDTESDTSLSYKIVSIEAIDKQGNLLLQNDQKFVQIQQFFAIERITGEVIVHSKVNRDFAAVVSLNISVTDVSSTTQHPQVAYGVLIITITDHNDNPPIFAKPWSPEKPDLFISIVEEQPVGTVVMNLLASDEDSDISHYEISPPSPYFDIGKESGVLSIKKVIDYESIVKESTHDLDLRTPMMPNQLRVNVMAYDSGSPQLSARATVYVNIVNLNDNEPVFNQTSYRTSIQENTSAGTFVAQVKATDGDYGKYGKISYSIISISGNGAKESVYKNYFSISNETGVIRVAAGAKIDRENGPNKITLQVAASDDIEKSRRLISVPIYITIDDVNDNKPIFTEREYEATTLGHADGPSKRIPVIQVTANDADDGLNGVVTYQLLSGNTNGVFEIDHRTGLISVAKPPIDVNPDVIEYRLTVEARDQNGQGPFNDRAIVKVKIIQVNHFKPKFLFPSQSSIEFYENQKPGTKVVRVQVYDEDSGNNGVVRLSFKIGGSTNVQETNEFKIDPDSGMIVAKKALDREVRDRYDLVLSAQDYLGEPQSFETLQQLTIIIKDVDDNQPEFERGFTAEETYLFTLYENMPRGSFIGKVHATDKDLEEENKKLFYHIIDGNVNHNFFLEKLTGVLYANQSFDREECDEYQLIIKASPKEHLTQTRHMDEDSIVPLKGMKKRSFNSDDPSLALVVVRVRDVNDNKPTFPKSVLRAGISYKADIGSIVSRARAYDPDAGLNSSLTYSVTGIDLYRKGYDNPDSPVRPIPSPFTFNEEGEIKSLQLMSQYPTGSRFVLFLDAKEKAPPFRSTQGKLYIWIYDPTKLIKVTLKLKPEQVNEQKDDIEDLFSSASEMRAIINEIKYHYDYKRSRVQKDWSDLYILFVDDRTYTEIAPQRVITKLDMNPSLFQSEKPINIEQISLASVSSVIDDDMDSTTILFFILITMICIGFVTMSVCFCCLKSWYHQKLLNKARKAAANAKIQAMKEREAAYSTRESILRGMSEMKIPESSAIDPIERIKPASNKNSADKRQQTRSPTDNPLWTESALKFYEEQELSMNVNPGDGLIPIDRPLPPTETLNGHYSTLLENTRTKMRQRVPESDNHEYHELSPNESSKGSSEGSENLGRTPDGEPELITHLL